MERTDCAYLVNTTQKYHYLIQPHFGLLQRYASGMTWPLFLVTDSEVGLDNIPGNPTIIILDKKDSGFWESRIAAVKALPEQFKYVLPIQDDFLLERPGPNWAAISEALELMETTHVSARLMPCPGPKGTAILSNPNWAEIDPTKDTYLFTYQATLWKRESYLAFLEALLSAAKRDYPQLLKDNRGWADLAINSNLAETAYGRTIWEQVFNNGERHIAWIRSGTWANAVYMCPWPYRPTAVVKGVLQQWAKNMLEREGFSI